MGSVHSVRELSLMRVSAVKVLGAEISEDPGAIERFIREAQITAQLEHPNIVPVHELGIDAQGKRYFTMKLVDGRTLAAWIDEIGRPVRDTRAMSDMLEVFLKVCDAVAFAHSRGVIHRDLKPENIMVGAFGQVYVMDWGLALQRTAAGPPDANPVPDSREPGPDSVGSALGVSSLAGTPCFMSPEQAYAEPIDERADIFSLGAVLYNIVTGRPPYDPLNPRRALEQAKAARVVFPADEGPWPKKLCEVIERATARDLEQRYSSVHELRRDLVLSLRGAPLPTQTFPAGAMIVAEGEAGDCAYVLLTGSCIVFKTLKTGPCTLRRLSAGAVFGETAVLSGGIRTASVQAETEVRVSVVSRDLLLQNLGMDSACGAFVGALADRFRELERRVHHTPDEPIVGDPDQEPSV
jgi:serine/threonine-protein kinase